MTELTGNIKRYPQDLISIYRCIREVGKRHPTIVCKRSSLSTVVIITYTFSVAKCRESLFDIDQRYMTKEPSTESLICK